jgi:hypothetical protein
LHGKTKLFRDAVIDEVTIGGELTGDGGGRGIKEGDFLTEGLADELDTQSLGRSDGGDGEKDLRMRLAHRDEDCEDIAEESVTYSPNIRQEKLANEKVDKEKTGSSGEQTGLEAHWMMEGCTCICLLHLCSRQGITGPRQSH